MAAARALNVGTSSAEDLPHPGSVDDAAYLADRVALLLHSLIPPAVRRAEQSLQSGRIAEEAMRELLVFHQDVISPISSVFAYALPCGQALRAIARHTAAIIEPGAGNGLWCALLQRAGVSAFAFDTQEPLRPYCDVATLSAGNFSTRACSATAHAALFLCWPPLEQEMGQHNSMAFDALAAYEGDVLLYCGEWRGTQGVVSSLSCRTSEYGQTAGARFQRAVEANWLLVEMVQLPRWPGFTDALYIFRRRNPRGGQRRQQGEAEVISTASTNPRTNASSSNAAAAASSPRTLHGSKVWSPRWDLAGRVQRVLHLGLCQPAAIAAALLIESELAANCTIEMTTRRNRSTRL